MDIKIVPIEQRHIAGFREVLDSVARERRWLAFVEAPALTRIRSFVQNGLRNGRVHCVAVDGDRVVGWCDVNPKTHVALRHSGVLGMGVAVTHRGQGVGAALLRTTLETAAARGLTRIELTVRADNAAAIALYRRFDFELEGRLRGYLLLDGQEYDALQMARLDRRHAIGRAPEADDLEHARPGS